MPEQNKDYLISKLKLAITLTLLLILSGWLVYFYRFGYNMVDAFYMTIITVATVGFGEVVPLNDEGKIFTAILILISIVVFAYAITTISAYLISVNSIFKFKRKKMQNRIDHLKNHVIICGYGRNGKEAVRKLQTSGKDFVVIEQNIQSILLMEDSDILLVEGNASEDESLIKAGIHNAEYLISTLPSDSDNVFITLTARQFNPDLVIISRASEESSIKKLRIAGANHIIMPDKIGGNHMASLIVCPDLIEFLDNLSAGAYGKMNVQEVMLSKLPKADIIGDLKIKENTGCTIIGYKNKSTEYIINPDPDQSVDADGRIIVLGRTDQIKRLNQMTDMTDK